MADTELYPRPLPDLTEDDRPDVSLVVPVFNEERTIEQVVSQAIEVLERDSRTFEVIVVDDGSRDATWATVERLHAGDARVKAVRFKRNFGQHPAMIA
jgi:glycosyltransferase involved in cell wall biosynthesis